MTTDSDVVRKPRFLVFSRNYILGDFQASFLPVSGRFDFAYLSDGVSAIGADTREIFYRALKDGLVSSELERHEIGDVMARCRLLRNLDAAQAENLVHAMTIALSYHIDRFRPDALISQMVDEYSSHLFALLAKKRNLGYLGYCAGYFPGTSLLLADAHGRPYRWRKADDAETAERLDRVSGVSFRQTYNLGSGYSLFKHVKSILRYRVKLVWFALRGWREQDPWNLHYRVTPYAADRRHLRDYPRAKLFSKDWAGELSRLRRERPDAKVIYMPLSYFPESTIDYWVLDKRMIDYSAMIQTIAAVLSKDHIVVVKEHLHMMGARDTSLLQELSAMDSVISVPPLELSNAVVAASDAVLLGSGSPGIEATLRGKPVVTFCDTSYWFAPAGATYLAPDAVDDWSDSISAAIAAHVPASPADQKAFVKACLEASTRVKDMKTIWPILDADDIAALLPELAGQNA